MIVVDSSVWIAHFRGLQTPAVARFGKIAVAGAILVGDVVMLEVLQGARDDAHAATLERTMRQFEITALSNEALAVRAARDYRKLRDLGVTVRKTIDMIIGTFCIAHGHVLLHDDRDFAPMEQHLGLQVV